jgi:mono/diheme cytochrome c family protein
MDPPAEATGPAAVRSGGQQSSAFLTTVAIPQCGSCHGADSKRKFKVGMLTQQLDGEERALILERLHSPDPEQGMPRDAAGKHVPLSKEQKRLWLKFLVQ